MSDPRIPVAPLLVVPATSLGVQGLSRPLEDGTAEPGVMIQLANAVVTCQMPLDIAQARQLVDDVQRAIIEAQQQASGLQVVDRLPNRAERRAAERG